MKRNTVILFGVIVACVIVAGIVSRIPSRAYCDIQITKADSMDHTVYVGYRTYSAGTIYIIIYGVGVDESIRSGGISGGSGGASLFGNLPLFRSTGGGEKAISIPAGATITQQVGPGDSFRVKPGETVTLIEYQDSKGQPYKHIIRALGSTAEFRKIMAETSMILFPDKQ